MTCFVILLASTASFITSHNLAPVKRDDRSASRVGLSHDVRRRTRRRSQPWNKYVLSRSGVYYASLHSHDTRQIAIKRTCTHTSYVHNATLRVYKPPNSASKTDRPTNRQTEWSVDTKMTCESQAPTSSRSNYNNKQQLQLLQYYKSSVQPIFDWTFCCPMRETFSWHGTPYQAAAAAICSPGAVATHQCVHTLTMTDCSLHVVARRCSSRTPATLVNCITLLTFTILSLTVDFASVRVYVADTHCNWKKYTSLSLHSLINFDVYFDDQRFTFLTLFVGFSSVV